MRFGNLIMGRLIGLVVLVVMLAVALVGCSGMPAWCEVEDVVYAADVDGDDYFFALDLFGFECEMGSE